MSQIKIIPTKDGSHTLLHEGLDETYHSAHGALTESEHVFLKEGLAHFLTQNSQAKLVNILEIGFGTGLNAILTWQEAQNTQQAIAFTTLEPYPIPEELIAQLNYTDLLGDWGNAQFKQLHELTWLEQHQPDTHFSFQKLTTKLEDLQEQEAFDIIFFDAFAPQKQPELWTVETLKVCYQALKPKGVLVTYCAQGQFKRDLKNIGFTVEKVAGPPKGKREMTRATKA